MAAFLPFVGTALSVVDSIAGGGLGEVIKGGLSLLTGMTDKVSHGDNEPVEPVVAQVLANESKTANMVADAVQATTKLPERATDWQRMSHIDARDKIDSVRENISRAGDVALEKVATNAKNSQGVSHTEILGQQIAQRESVNLFLDKAKPKHMAAVGMTMREAIEQKQKNPAHTATLRKYLEMLLEVPKYADSVKGSLQHTFSPYVEVYPGASRANDDQKMLNPLADMLAYTSYDGVRADGDLDAIAGTWEGNCPIRATESTVYPVVGSAERDLALPIARQIFSAVNGSRAAPQRRVTLSGKKTIVPQQSSSGAARTNYLDLIRGVREAFVGDLHISVDGKLLKWPLKYGIVEPFMFETTRRGVSEYIISLEGFICLYVATLSATILSPVTTSTKFWFHPQSDFTDIPVVVMTVKQKVTFDEFNDNMRSSKLRELEVINVVDHVLRPAASVGPGQVMAAGPDVVADPIGAPFGEAQCTRFEARARGLRARAASGESIFWIILPSPDVKLNKYYPAESVYERAHIEQPNFFPRDRWWSDGPSHSQISDPAGSSQRLELHVNQFIDPFAKNPTVAGIIKTTEVVRVEGVDTEVTTPKWTNLDKPIVDYAGLMDSGIGLNAEGIYSVEAPLGTINAIFRALTPQDSVWTPFITALNRGVVKAAKADKTDTRTAIDESALAFGRSGNLFGRKSKRELVKEMLDYLLLSEDYLQRAE